MRTKRLSKKGIGFLFYASIGILLSVILLLFLTAAPELELEALGTNPYDVLYTTEIAEAAKVYIDQSMNLAARWSVLELFKRGGLYYEVSDTGDTSPPCGTYLYTLYSSPDYNCTPHFPSAYSEYFRTLLADYFASYEPFALTMSVDVDLKQLPHQTVQVQGRSSHDVMIPLRETSVSKTNSLAKKTTTYPQGTLGGYGQERIVNCTTGKCFADIATYYHQLYSTAGGLPYVWGGESPYSYQDTVDDKDTNPDSFFKGVVVTMLQPGKYRPTIAGFDCSGFLWWVGKHAGIDYLSNRMTADNYRKQAIRHATLVCGENKNRCTLDILLSEAQPGDVLFYAPSPGAKIDHVMIYVGNGEIVHSRGSRGLVREYLPSSYVTHQATKIEAVYRFPYKNHGISSLSQINQGASTPFVTFSTPLSLSNVNTVSFTPFMNATTRLDLDALAYISDPHAASQDFLEALHSCNDDLRACIQEQVTTFNSLPKPTTPQRVHVTRNGEEDALAYDIVEQLLDCYRNGQERCVCLITINKTLASRHDDFALHFSRNGEVHAGEERLNGLRSSTEEFITILPFDPTVNYHDPVRANPVPTPTSVVGQTTITQTSSSTTPSSTIAIPSTGTLTTQQRQVLITQHANNLNIDPHMAFALFDVEAGGVAFCPDGKPLIRFEPHIFGQRHPDAPWAVPYPSFASPAERTQANNLMKETWEMTYDHGSSCATNHKEWIAFEDALQMNAQAAYESISSGLAQMMGFNHDLNGYNTAQEQFEAFSHSEKAQIDALFSFIENKRGLLSAIRTLDFARTAYLYNGQSQNCEEQSTYPQECYSAKLRRAYERHGGMVLSGAQQTITNQMTRPPVRDYVELFVDKQSDLVYLEIEQPLRDEVWDVPFDTQEIAVVKTTQTDLAWLRYTNDYDHLLCRDNKHYFRFTAQFTFTNLTLPFSFYATDTTPPLLRSTSLSLQPCTSFVGVLFTWELPALTEPIYAFDIYISNTSSIPTHPTYSLPLQTATQISSVSDVVTTQELFVIPQGTINRYHYLLSGFEAFDDLGRETFVRFASDDTYSFVLGVVDHYNNSRLTQQEQFSPSQLPLLAATSSTCIQGSSPLPFSSLS